MAGISGFEGEMLQGLSRFVAECWLVRRPKEYLNTWNKRNFADLSVPQIEEYSRKGNGYQT